MSKAKKSLNSDAFTRLLAEETGMKLSEVKDFMGKVRSVLEKNLRSYDKISVPEVGDVKIKHKKARPAGTRVAFGETIRVSARPAHKVVDMKLSKKLREYLM
jgi:nucleoid DNA-binding protein